VTLQNVYDYVEDFLDSDEWMEDDLMLPSSASASSHDGLKSPPPYSHQSALTDFGNTDCFAPVTYLLFDSCLHGTFSVLDVANLRQ